MTAATLDPTRPETWPLVMTFGEVCQVLRIGLRAGQRARQHGRFTVPELLPRLAGTPRYSRDDVVQWVKSRSGQATALERRRAMSAR